MIADNDLLSIQQARIFAENAFEAQKKLALFPQEKLDSIVEGVATAAARHARDLAVFSQKETDYGNWTDKLAKNLFVCSEIPKRLRGMRCVGLIGQDPENRLMDIGVPVGVIAALCPVTSPVSTAIYTTLLAIKSGNALVFSPHPRAIKSIGRVLDIMIDAAEAHGLPQGCLAYLDTVSKSGTMELLGHTATSLNMITGVPGMFRAARCVGKPIIYGGMGNGPAFVERTANISQAVRDIVHSKTFDNGIMPSAEQSVVVDACVVHGVKDLFRENGAYFMTDEESLRLAGAFFHADGRCKKSMVGQPAGILAKRAGIPAPEDVTVLMAERKYVSAEDPYCKGFLAPVLACYVEENWEHACEKCIELLLHEKNGHSLVIHSSNEEVIHQFALKKPVGRLLVNTPAALGGTGMTTNLFPAMTLGSGSAGYGITSDNVSPLNLIYTRKVGYGVRQPAVVLNDTLAPAQASTAYTLEEVAPAMAGVHCNGEKGNQEGGDAAMAQVLRRILTEAVNAMDGFSADNDEHSLNGG